MVVVATVEMVIEKKMMKTRDSSRGCCCSCLWSFMFPNTKCNMFFCLVTFFFFLGSSCYD